MTPRHSGFESTEYTQGLGQGWPWVAWASSRYGDRAILCVHQPQLPQAGRAVRGTGWPAAACHLGEHTGAQLVFSAPSAKNGPENNEDDTRRLH